MPVAARTYTFRASGDLGDRIRAASVFLDEIEEAAGSEVSERIARELVLALLRDTRRFRGASGNQSAFMRETVELVVSAAQKVAADLEYADAYARGGAERTSDEEEFRRAARTRAGERWRDA